ncbi:MAG TPA: hypothetical protein VH351_05370 [Bryobacteraceae bacterium]|jgi:hypothetical protein|nr:hypothetical protein [Bryobacteraceae bacterium]
MRRLTEAFFVLILCGGTAAFGSVESDLMAMAPAETTLLSGIDVARTKASPFGAYLLNEMSRGNGHLPEFMAATGFDPRRDLQQVLLAGVAGKSGPNSRFAILARGTFDEARIRTAVLANGGSVSTINGLETLLIPKHRQNEQRENGVVGLAFPKPGLAVLGDVKTLQEVLSPRASNQNLDALLVDQVNHVGSENDIWFATLMSGSFLGHQLADGAPPNVVNSGALKSILRSSGGMQFGTNVAMSLDLFTRSADDARSVTELLRFAGNLAQMQNNPQGTAAAAALSNLELQTEGSTVHASLNVTEQQMEQLMQSGKKPLTQRQ